MSKWWMLLVTTGATSLVFLDQTVLPVALPAIQNHFFLSEVELLWVVNIYLMTLMSFLLIGGRIADLFGKRKAYLIGLLFSLTGSLLGGVSFSPLSLLLARTVQGTGAALILPTTSALLVATFPPETRARAIGINTGISALFLALGPVVSGFLTEFVSWRMIFWVNIPTILFAMGMTLWLVKKAERNREERFHFIGAFAIVAAVVSFVVALMQGNVWGWHSWPILFLFLLAPLFALLFIYLSLNERHPLLDFRVFKNLPFSGAILAIFMTQMMIAVTVFWSIYFQNDLGYSPSKTGAIILIATLPVLLTAPLSGFLADRYGSRLPMMTGFIILMAALGWVASMGLAKNIALLAPGLLGFGLGIPLIFSPAIAAALSHVPINKLGSSAAIMTAARQFAATTGIAVMTALFQGVIERTGSQPDAFAAVSLLAALFALSGFLIVCFLIPRKKGGEVVGVGDTFVDADAVKTRRGKKD